MKINALEAVTSEGNKRKTTVIPVCCLKPAE
jgi:hypothetical protein